MKTFLIICVILLVVDVVVLNLIVSYLLDSLKNINSKLRSMEYINTRRMVVLQRTARSLVFKINKLLRKIE